MDNELFELCKQVYEATGWDGTRESFYETRFRENSEWHDGSIKVMTSLEADYYKIRRVQGCSEVCPLYTSDYLLEKLPKQLPYIGGSPAGVWFNSKVGKWQTGYLRHVQGSDDNVKEKYFYADTPLKALLKLVIALDDAGVKL